MDAKIINLEAYKASHPLGLRLFNNSVKCWWNWYSLPFIIAARNARNLQNGVLFGGRKPK